MELNRNIVNGRSLSKVQTAAETLKVHRELSRANEIVTKFEQPERVFLSQNDKSSDQAAQDPSSVVLVSKKTLNWAPTSWSRHLKGSHLGPSNIDAGQEILISGQRGQWSGLS